jgi:hypothetical protein
MEVKCKIIVIAIMVFDLNIPKPDKGKDTELSKDFKLEKIKGKKE